jgi:hypothetical protein
LSHLLIVEELVLHAQLGLGRLLGFVLAVGRLKNEKEGRGE